MCFIYDNIIITILYILKANLGLKTYVLHVFQFFNYRFVNWAVQHNNIFLCCTLYSKLLNWIVRCTVHYCTALSTVQFITVPHCTLYSTILHCTLNCTVLLYCVLHALELNAPFTWALELLIQNSIGSLNYETTVQLYCIDLHTCSSHI